VEQRGHLQEVVHELAVVGGASGFFRALVEFAEGDEREEERFSGPGQRPDVDPSAQVATTTLVWSRMPAARSAMCFHAAGVVHGLLEGFAVGFAQHAVGAPEHGGTFALRAGAEAVDVAGDFDLLAQG
jgi:hypothetical protein